MEFDPYSLASIGAELHLVEGTSPGITGEEFGAYMDANNVIHGAGIVGRMSASFRSGTTTRIE